MWASGGRSLRSQADHPRRGRGCFWGDGSWFDERNRPRQPRPHGPAGGNAVPAGPRAAGLAPFGPGSFQKSRPLAGWRAPAAGALVLDAIGRWQLLSHVCLLFFFSLLVLAFLSLGCWPFSPGVAMLLAGVGKSGCCVPGRFIGAPALGGRRRRRRGRLLAHSSHSRFSGDEKAPLRNGCRPGLGSCGVFLSFGPCNLELGCERSERIKNHLCSPCCPDGRLPILR